MINVHIYIGTFIAFQDIKHFHHSRKFSFAVLQSFTHLYYSSGFALFFLISLPVLKFHANGIISYVFFCAWLSSLNIIFWDSSRLFNESIVYPFLLLSTFSLYEYTTICESPLCEYTTCCWTFEQTLYKRRFTNGQ